MSQFIYLPSLHPHPPTKKENKNISPPHFIFLQIFYQSEEIWAGSYCGSFCQFVVLLYFVWVDMCDFGTGLPIVPHPLQGRVVLQTLLGQGTPTTEARKVRLRQRPKYNCNNDVTKL